MASGGVRAGGTIPSIGYFSSRSSASEAPLAAWFREGLAEFGFVDGRTITIEPRFSNGQDGKLPELAAELLAHRVSMLVATDGPSAKAAKSATGVVPIVFTSGRDPVQDGVVASFSRPGGNATGVAILTATLGPKRFQLLREMVPGAARVGFLYNTDSDTAEAQVRQVQQAATEVGQPLLTFGASTERALDEAFAAMSMRTVDAFFTSANLFFQVQRLRIVQLAARHAIPGMYEWPEFPSAGGLMSYSTSRMEAFRIAGRYAGRILKGEKPAELPVAESTRFELVINLKTAKTLGLAIPPSLLARADEVIE